MSVKKIKVGIIGCGNISDIYFRTCRSFDVLDLVACADLLPEKAQAKAAQYPEVRAVAVESLLAEPEIGIVVNLTVPGAHADVALAALDSGKSVYNEKPLATRRAEGHRIIELARKKKLRVGCAPDTFMGAGIQTCRKLIDDGVIGQPVAATAFMTCHGHESWHPNPEFYYEVGGGPMFDMGPYYLTALIALMGPVRRVTGSARITFPERTIGSEPKRGKKIAVQVPTHVAGIMDFQSGAIGTILTSFDVWAAALPRIEIYGTEGSLSVPDPNGFGGTPRVWTTQSREWHDVPLAFDYEENTRGIGVADMAYALHSGRPHRAGGDLAFHVLDLMEAFHEASSSDRHVVLKSSCQRPAAMPQGLPKWHLDK